MTADAAIEENTYPWYTTYEDVDACIMMTGVFWILVLTVVVYLAFVLKIGPDLMRNRRPFELKETLFIYNIFQVVFSAIIAYYSLRALWHVGIFPKRTPQMDPEIRTLMIPAALTFYLGKFTELFDTIFFVLRKKNNQISFLHVYHHSSVIIGSWVIVKYGLSNTCMWASFMNASVHVVMYFYYFMAALGPEYQKYLFWKKYITTFQMVQFATVFLHQTASLIFTKGEYTIAGLIYIYFSSQFFFFLFLRFYLQTYNKKGSEKKEVAKDDTKVQ